MQENLFPDDAPPARTEALVPQVKGPTRALSKTQKRFNQLIARLKAQRLELVRWKRFQQEFQERMARDYQPVADQLRQQRIAMAKLFDRRLDGGELGSRQRTKLRDIFCELVRDLLAEARDEELVRLYDKHALVASADEQQAAFELMSTLAQETFGIDTQNYEGAEDPDELAEWIDAQVHGAGGERPAPGRQREPTGRVSAAKLAKAESGSRAMREVFRKLVSELHPDREADPAQRLLKTDLMKEVNLAYEAGDLLRLLEMQLQIEQIDNADITRLAEQQLKHYIVVFEEQSRQLQTEIDDLIEPLSQVSGHRASTALTPEFVRQAIDADIRSLKQAVRDVKGDLAQFQDIRQFREILRHYRTKSPDVDPMPETPRRRRART